MHITISNIIPLSLRLNSSWLMDWNSFFIRYAHALFKKKSQIPSVLECLKSDKSCEETIQDIFVAIDVIAALMTCLKNEGLFEHSNINLDIKFQPITATLIVGNKVFDVKENTISIVLKTCKSLLELVPKKKFAVSEINLRFIKELAYILAETKDSKVFFRALSILSMYPSNVRKRIHDTIQGTALNGFGGIVNSSHVKDPLGNYNIWGRFVTAYRKFCLGQDSLVFQRLIEWLKSIICSGIPMSVARIVHCIFKLLKEVFHLTSSSPLRPAAIPFIRELFKLLNPPSVILTNSLHSSDVFRIPSGVLT
jgi:hypothetical protein